jgi:hypothetical protein
MKDYYEDNKEKIKEYKLKYQKDYYQKNKEKMKDYYQENKKYKLEYSKDYIEKNKEKIKERKSIRVICECGLEVNKDGIARHKRTQRHVGNLI